MTRSAKPLLSFMLVAMLSLLAGCGGSAPPPLPASAAGVSGETSYALAGGDRIKVNVFGHEDLSGEFQLDGAGNFALPLIGEVKADGLTTRELEKRIEDQFAQGYLRDPKVSIEVLNYRPFYILGEVKAPGSFPYVNGMTVLNAVALAGGFTYRADQTDIVLRRGGANGKPYSVTGDTTILPGDVIEVQERYF
jgi:polysaccharide export outer membrane protein